MNCRNCNAAVTEVELFCKTCGAKNMSRKFQAGGIGSLVANALNEFKNGEVKGRKSGNQTTTLLIFLVCVYGVVNGISFLATANFSFPDFLYPTLVMIASLIGLVVLAYRGIKNSKSRPKSTVLEKVKSLIGLSPVACRECNKQYSPDDSFCRECGVRRPRTTALMILARSSWLAGLVLLVITGIVAAVEYALLKLQVIEAFQISTALVTGVAGLIYLGVLFMILNAVVSFFRFDE